MLYNVVSFCCTTTGISPKYVYTPPSRASLPPFPNISIILAEVQVTYNMAIVSGVQEDDGYTYTGTHPHTRIYMFSFSYPSTVVYFRILNKCPVTCTL